MSKRFNLSDKNSVAIIIMVVADLAISVNGAASFGLPQIILIAIGVGLIAWLSANPPPDFSELAPSLKAYAQGNFAVKCDVTGDDMRATLARAINEIGDNFQRLRAQQAVMTQKHNEGWIDEKIDTSKFTGAYAELAEAINSLVKSHIDVRMHVVDIVTRYAKADFSQDVERLPGKKATITAAIDGVRDQLKAAAQASLVNSRIKMALDATSTSVMIADVAGQIIYSNESVSKLLAEAEPDIRKELPQFRAREVVGGSFDRFHSNVAHQQNLLSHLRAPHKVDISVGGRFFGLIATPMFDEKGERLGTVVEWKDRAAEIAAEKAASENARIKMALDATSTSAMIADANGDIIYMNNSVATLLKEAEVDIRKDLPDFRADQVVGGSFDRFHKNISHQRNMLAKLRAPHKVDITVGGRIFGLIATPMFSDKNERLGTVVEWKDRAFELEAERSAQANSRIRQALDKCSTSVMIADAAGTIIYMNESVSAMMRKAESDIRKDLPQFNTDGIIGGSFDRFHKNPAMQHNMLGSLRGVHRTQIVVGGRTMALIASPITTPAGERLGTVVEWNDRTAEVQVEGEIASIVEGAVQGNFNNRIDPTGKSGFFGVLANGMNRLMDASESGLSEVVRVLKSIASGDLTQRITANYSGLFGELKEYSNTTSDQLASIINDVRNAADSLNSAAEQVSSTAQSLSQSASEQAAGVERTSSSVEQLASSVAQNTENAKVTDSMATKSATEAVEGGDAVTRTAEAMKQIANKVGIIDDIADQTNLLALNAAIEAARAGASGKGFAVVAAEVRKLAERSQIASKEIGELASNSVQMSETAGKLLNAMIPSIRKTSDLVQEITAASDEQTTGLSHISSAMGQLNQATQQNAAASEQLAATAEEMSGQAGALQQLMDFFKLDINDPIRVAPDSTRRPTPSIGGGGGGMGNSSTQANARAKPAALLDESQFKRF